MTDIVLDEMGAADPALVVELQLGFRHAQLQGASLDSSLSKHHGQVAHSQEEIQYFRIDLGRFRLGEDVRYLLVSKPLAGTDGAIGEARLRHLAGWRQV